MKAALGVVLFFVFVLLLPLPTQAARRFPRDRYEIRVAYLGPGKSLTIAQAMTWTRGAVYAVPANFSAGRLHMGRLVVNGKTHQKIELIKLGRRLDRCEAGITPRGLTIGYRLDLGVYPDIVQAGPCVFLRNDGTVRIRYVEEGFWGRLVTQRRPRNWLCAHPTDWMFFQFEGDLVAESRVTQQQLRDKMLSHSVRGCINLDGGQQLDVNKPSTAILVVIDKRLREQPLAQAQR